MYRSKYGFKAARDQHEVLETVESTINKHLLKPEPEFKTLLVPYEVRNRHIYVVGKTQHGKSTLLSSIISQDIEMGAGVCVIDPKPSGDKPNLVDTILQHIPEYRKDDVIYFDAGNPVPIDVMTWETEEERQTLAADLMLTFMQFVAQKDGDRWPSILRYAIHTILEAGDCTFLDIHDFLADEGRRKEILARVKNLNLQKYWADNGTFKHYPKDAALPIIARMAQFVLVPPLNIMLGTAKPKLKIQNVILDRKILLVNLTGAGKESGNLIGTLLVSKIQQAIFRRLRTPFHLFADEFQNFQTSAFDTILSEAGGLGLRLTLANQYVHQLDERIRRSVFGNVSTFFVFTIDDADTHYFKSKMPCDAPDERLAQQPPFQALYVIAGQVAQFKTIPKPLPPVAPEDLERADYIRKRTLDLYGCKPDPRPHNADSGKPEPEGTVLSDETQEGGPRPARPVLRPSEQRPRVPSPKPRSNPNRHPDDKPEP
jgi:hypothetical protein